MVFDSIYIENIRHGFEELSRRREGWYWERLFKTIIFNGHRGTESRIFIRYDYIFFGHHKRIEKIICIEIGIDFFMVTQYKNA